MTPSNPPHLQRPTCRGQHMEGQGSSLSGLGTQSCVGVVSPTPLLTDSEAASAGEHGVGTRRASFLPPPPPPLASLFGPEASCASWSCCLPPLISHGLVCEMLGRNHLPCEDGSEDRGGQLCQSPGQSSAPRQQGAFSDTRENPSSSLNSCQVGGDVQLIEHRWRTWSSLIAFCALSYSSIRGGHGCHQCTVEGIEDQRVTSL